MWLCTKDLIPLRLIDGDIDSVLELSGLMALLQQAGGRRSDPSGTAYGINETEMHIRVKAPRNITLITYVMSISGMAYIFQPTVGDILWQGSNRYCREDRSEAIMSVLGVDNWKGRNDPNSKDTVLEKYSLAFLEEVRRRWGSSLFYVLSPSKEAESIRIGSMLPFKAGYRPYFQGPQRYVSPQDLFEHDSVRKWKIQQNGNVVIHEAAIIAASGMTGEPIQATFFDRSMISTMQGQLPEEMHMEMDLLEWMAQQEHHNCYAVCTGYFHEYNDFSGNTSWTCLGLLFLEISDVPQGTDNSDRPEPLSKYLVKYGHFFVTHAGTM